MSKLRIAIVAEGDTDIVIIQAILKNIIQNPFVLTILQPNTSIAFSGNYGPNGGGWPGVFQWCQQIVSQKATFGCSIECIPALKDYDLIIIHTDADVASFTYSSANISDPPLNNLPCNQPCPSPMDSINVLKQVILSWMEESSLPECWILCIPSKCTEAWVVALKYNNTGNQILNNLECDMNLEHWLSLRPISEGERFTRKKSGNLYKKNTRVYRTFSDEVTKKWPSILHTNSSANAFNSDLVNSNCLCLTSGEENDNFRTIGTI